MENCKICSNALPDDGEYAHCNKCNENLHFGKCSGIKESSWKTMSNPKKSVWKCVPCREPPLTVNTPRSRNSSNLSEDESELQDPTEIKILEFIRKENKKHEMKMLAMMEDFKKSLMFTQGSIDEMNKTMKNVEKKLVVVEKEQEKMKVENTELKSKVRKLEVTVQEMMQKQFLNKIEITGIPTTNTSDAISLAKNFINKVDLQETEVKKFTAEKNITYVSENVSKMNIVIGFESQYVRNEVLKKMRKDKMRLKLGDLTNKGENNEIYVNECLSAYFKKLFYEVKKIQKAKNYEHLWVRDGKILMKKAVGAKVMQITSNDDLGKI